MAVFSRVLICVALAFAVCSAFNPASTQSFHRNSKTVCTTQFNDARVAPLRMSEEEEVTALVPVEKENVEVSAGVAGLVAGTLLGGPVVGVLLSVASNYVSKQESDVGEVARGVGKTALEAFNFVATLAKKYTVGEKVSEAAGSAMEKLKEYDTDAQIVTKVETTLKTTSEKVAELDKEYNLAGKTGELLKQAGDLSSAAVDKVIEYNKEYKLTDKLTEKIGEVVEKTKEQATPPPEEKSKPSA